LSRESFILADGWVHGIPKVGDTHYSSTGKTLFYFSYLLANVDDENKLKQR
jgi:hypothetical protein